MQTEPAEVVTQCGHFFSQVCIIFQPLLLFLNIHLVRNSTMDALSTRQYCV